MVTQPSPRAFAALSIALAIAVDSSALAQSKGTPEDSAAFRSVLVLPVEAGEDGDAELQGWLDARVLLAVRNLDRFQVFDRTELEGLAAASDTQSKAGCLESAQCVAEVTGKLGANLVLAIRVGRLGDGWALSMNLVAGKEAEVKGRGRAQGASVEALGEEIPALVETVFAGLAGGGSAQRMTVEMLGDNPTIAVMDLADQGVGERVASSLTDALAVEMSRQSDAKVFSSNDMKAVLGLEAARQAVGCDDVSCMVEIGGALGARFIVSGSVGRLSDRYVVNVRVIDSKAAEVVGSESESFLGPVDELLVGMRFLVERLFSRTPEGSGRLRLAIAQEETRVSLNGDAAGQTPKLKLPESLSVGKHLLELEADGYFPLTRETYIEAARVTSLNLSLEPLPTPWYKTWWFWTLTSVVVAGATAGVIVASDSSSASAGDGEAIIRLGAE